MPSTTTTNVNISTGNGGSANATITEPDSASVDGATKASAVNVDDGQSVDESERYVQE